MATKIRYGSIDEVEQLTRDIPEFGDSYGYIDYLNRLDEKEHLILVAERDNQLVGFKVAYDEDRNGRDFYSWIGGVLPDHRRLKVASLLLSKMEMWCRLKGYERIYFKTYNMHSHMIIFALKHGFFLYDFQPDIEDRAFHKLYLEKHL